MNTLAKSIIAMSALGLGSTYFLGQRPEIDSYDYNRPMIVYSQEKQQQRNIILANALKQLGKPSFSQNNPESLACIDVFVRSTPRLEEKLREDYQSLPEPERRYVPIDLRLPTCVSNLKELVLNDFKNTPHNPFFARRIQNVLRYQQAHHLFFGPGEGQPQPGMIVYWTKKKNSFPTHSGVVASVKDNKVMEVIQASASKGKVVRTPGSEIEEAGYSIYGFGDAPNF